tara:strand:+ start:537 stop:815 length:279 start_codon:yes stop_codon:yes gene_type:complete
MIVNFKVGDLVRFEDINSEDLTWESLPIDEEEPDMLQGLITGFVDIETGQRLYGNIATHDKVVGAFVLGPKGTQTHLVTSLELVSAAQGDQC